MFTLIVGGFITLVIVGGIVIFWGPNHPKPQVAQPPAELADYNGADYQNARVTIQTVRGPIVFELYPDKAPKTVENFVRLAESGYYTGLSFHRSDANVIQGGDPLGNGTGGTSYWGSAFEDEPVQGDYVAGCVAMANSGPNTNGSQFFICKTDWLELPKQYNLFGQVVEGLDIVQTIQVGDIMQSVSIEKVTPVNGDTEPPASSPLTPEGV